MTAMMRSLDLHSQALAALVGATGPMEFGNAGDGDLLGAPRLGPARGGAALEQWRRTLLAQPEVVTARIRRNRDQALGGAAGLPGPANTMRAYLASEVPFGNAKTAAYLLFGLADVCDLMEHGR